MTTITSLLLTACNRKDLPKSYPNPKDFTIVLLKRYSLSATRRSIQHSQAGFEPTEAWVTTYLNLVVRSTSKPPRLGSVPHLWKGNLTDSMGWNTWEVSDIYSDQILFPMIGRRIDPNIRQDSDNASQADRGRLLPTRSFTGRNINLLSSVVSRYWHCSGKMVLSVNRAGFIDRNQKTE